MFIGCNASQPFSFCFSTARLREPTRAQIHVADCRSGEPRLAKAAPPKNKKKIFGGSPGYKHCTPNGVVGPASSSQPQFQVLKLCVTPVAEARCQ